MGYYFDTFEHAVKFAKRIISEVERLFGSSPYADPCLACYLAYTNPDGPYPEGASELYLDLLVKCSVKYKDSHDGLRNIAGYLLHENQPLPDLLRQWLEEYRTGNNPLPPDRKHYRDRNAIRNVAIRAAMDHLTWFGMKATRNDASAPYSAADAVAQAMTEILGKRFSCGAVKTIWHNRKKWPDLADRATFAFGQRVLGAGQNKSNQRG